MKDGDDSMSNELRCARSIVSRHDGKTFLSMLFHLHRYFKGQRPFSTFVRLLLDKGPSAAVTSLCHKMLEN